MVQSCPLLFEIVRQLDNVETAAAVRVSRTLAQDGFAPCRVERGELGRPRLVEEELVESLESTFHSAAHPQPLWVRGSLCANPECECGDVFLELLDRTVRGRAGQNRPVLELRVATQTWQEVDAPAVPGTLRQPG